MGNGTIYRRGNSWCVGFTVNGRRVRETVGPNKKIAERVLSLRMTQVLENRYFPPNRQLGRMPFKDFAQMYLEREDRKSTRLNSSHTVISYAVFCLKKKT